MRFQPKTQKEIDEANLIPEGEYGFVISIAEDKVSKAGNDMIALTLRVYKEDGSFLLVNDYLMESMAHKLRHASEACGLLDRYESGELEAADFLGREAYCKIKIQKDKNGQYPDKNVIGDYVVKKFKEPDDALDKMIKETASNKIDDLEDDLPF